METETLRCGLIGAGRIGRLHADHLAHRIRRASLEMVTDVAVDAARQCAESCGVRRFSANYHDLLSSPDIDAVLICSSTDTHAEMIEAAAAAGKQIFCEKPIDFDLQRIDRALAAVEKAGVLLQIGFNRRFDSNFRRVRDALLSGEIGKPHLLHIVSRDPAPPPIEYVKKSGGIFLDMTIHDFDMARFLLGREVEEVYATGRVQIDGAIGEAGDYDTAVIMLNFADGIVATIENSRQAVYGYDQRVEAFGAGGSISVGNNYPNTATIRGEQAVCRDLPLNFFIDRYLESYVEELRQFVEAALAGSPAPVSGADGRIPVVIGKAAKLSAQQNRPVRLDEIDRPLGLDEVDP